MSLEDIASKNEPNNFDDYAPALVMLNDIHGDLDILERSVDALKKYDGKKIISLSDYFDHHHRMEVFQSYGIKDTKQLYVEKVRNKLNPGDEREVFDYLFTIQSVGGLDQYLNLVKNSGQIDQRNFEDFAKEQINNYNQAEKSFKELNLEEKTRLTETEIQELTNRDEETKKLAAKLDKAMNIYEAEGLAKVINKSGDDIVWVMNSGNHDPVNAWSEVYNLLNNKSQLVDANKINGVMSLGGKLNVAFAGNCYGISNPSDILAYGQENISQLYPHMDPHGVAQDLKISDLENLTKEDLSLSKNWDRITNKGNDGKSIDVLALHSELGTPLGYGGGKSLYPNLDDIGLLYLSKKQMSENGIITAGHIHNEAEGENDYGTKTMRGPAIFIAKEEGSMVVKRIEKKEYSSKYDLKRIEEILRSLPAETKSN